MKHVELDPDCPLNSQFADTSPGPVILINLFSVDPKDNNAFKIAWAKDSEFFKAQPGFISAQLHHGIGDSHLWLNYAVFESAAQFGATNNAPDFGPLRKRYPESAVTHPHLFRRVRIPGVCIGEVS